MCRVSQRIGKSRVKNKVGTFSPTSHSIGEASGSREADRCFILFSIVDSFRSPFRENISRLERDVLIPHAKENVLTGSSKALVMRTTNGAPVQHDNKPKLPHATCSQPPFSEVSKLDLTFVISSIRLKPLVQSPIILVLEIRAICPSSIPHICDHPKLPLTNTGVASSIRIPKNLLDRHYGQLEKLIDTKDVTVKPNSNSQPAETTSFCSVTSYRPTSPTTPPLCLQCCNQCWKRKCIGVQGPEKERYYTCGPIRVDCLHTPVARLLNVSGGEAGAGSRIQPRQDQQESGLVADDGGDIDAFDHQENLPQRGPKRVIQESRAHSTGDSKAPHGSSSIRNSGISSACTTVSQSQQSLLEVLSSSTNEGCDDSHSEEESPLCEQAERRLTSLRDHVELASSAHTSLGVPDPMQDGESSSSRAGPSASSERNSSHNQQSKSHDSKGKRMLSRRGENNDNDEDGEYSRPKRPKSSADGDETKLFACPYYQWKRCQGDSNMELRKACYGPGFPSIHRLREHLYRAHILQLRCSRCYMTFECASSFNCHSRQDPPCEVKEEQLGGVIGIDFAIEHMLRYPDKEFNDKTPEGKWRHIYTLLFPADNPGTLPSPYLDIVAPADDSLNSSSMAESHRPSAQGKSREIISQASENESNVAPDSATGVLANASRDQRARIVGEAETELDACFLSHMRRGEERGPQASSENVAQVPMSGSGSAVENCDAPWSVLRAEGQHMPSSSPVTGFSNESMGGMTTTGADLDINLEELGGPYDPDAPTLMLFRVKAVRDYLSDHPCDLRFNAGQIINVIMEYENVGWCYGEYFDGFGTKKIGAFPSNYVEMLAPSGPPQPTTNWSPLVA
ncbi:hypothetical protein F5Y06DRAFT_268942 [Hypoxylon sp. FL0890]|nr:hypothetical protein F5Y06DRAFT_268942 [Hypoxylon sp. FL0890]